MKAQGDFVYIAHRAIIFTVVMIWIPSCNNSKFEDVHSNLSNHLIDLWYLLVSKFVSLSDFLSVLLSIHLSVWRVCLCSS